MSTRTFNLSQELVNETAGLIYHQWATAHDTLKAVKAEKNDRSEDWELFHKARLEKATEREGHWSKMLREITPHHTIGKESTT